MSDLIDRQAVIDAVKGRFSMPVDNLIVEVIEALPSAEPKRGKWILYENQRQEDVDNGNYLYTCSECGKSDIHAKTQEVPFCWWCGADMRGEEDELRQM